VLPREGTVQEVTQLVSSLSGAEKTHLLRPELKKHVDPDASGSTF